MFRGTLARLNCCAVDRSDPQRTVRMCSKAAANPTSDDWLKLKTFRKICERISTRWSRGFSDRKAPTRLPIQSDSDWSGERKKWKSVSSGNVRFGHHHPRSWSKAEHRRAELRRGRAVRRMHGCATDHEYVKRGTRIRS